MSNVINLEKHRSRIASALVVHNGRPPKLVPSVPNPFMAAWLATMKAYEDTLRAIEAAIKAPI
jgi:hypothetical protein